MKYITLLLAFFLLNGCAVVYRTNYHGVLSNEGKYETCRELVREHKINFVIVSTGAPNYQIIKNGGNNIIVCTDTESRDSYFAGLGFIVPFIPIPYRRSANTPKFIEFIIANKSDDNSIKYIPDGSYESCELPEGQGIDCEFFAKSNSKMIIPARTVLRIKLRYKEKIPIKIQLNKTKTKTILFQDNRGTIYFITG